MALIPKNSVALAGEFAVLSQLMLRGYDAGLTLGNTKKVDILVHDPVSDRQFEIEVKTNLENRNGPSRSKLFGSVITGWQMDKKHEDIRDPNLYYSFVHINVTRTEPLQATYRFFNVPSGVVADYVRDEHQLWLNAEPSRQTIARRVFRIGAQPDPNFKVPAPLASSYEDNWRFDVQAGGDDGPPSRRLGRRSRASQERSLDLGPRR